jgi:antagonist of KipI
MSILFKKVSTLVTVQDGGRKGFQSQGVPVCGAMDEESFVQANMLVGNSRGAACLEIASGSLEILFETAYVIALTGGGTKAIGQDKAILFNRRAYLPAGTQVKFSPTHTGFWSYLALVGAIEIEPILGSQATYLPASFGGLEGRKLQGGDRLEVTIKTEPLSIENQTIKADSWRITSTQNSSTIRLIQGPDFSRLTDKSKNDLANQNFTVSADSNRMGYRLSGKPLKVQNQAEIISTPVTRGTMQLTNDGTPIVLMADAQTIGGYPRIAQVAAVDIPRLAQKRAGEAVRFEFISYAEACALFLKREQEGVKTEMSIRLKLKEHAGRFEL